MDDLRRFLYMPDGTPRTGRWYTCKSCGEIYQKESYCYGGSKGKRTICRYCAESRAQEKAQKEAQKRAQKEAKKGGGVEKADKGKSKIVIVEVVKTKIVEANGDRKGGRARGWTPRRRDVVTPPALVSGLERLDYNFVRSRLVIRAGGECTRCQYSEFFHSLQFHHRDPKEKFIDIRDAIGMYCTNPSEERRLLLMREIDKCVLLCANCHMSLHAGAWKLQGEKS